MYIDGQIVANVTSIIVYITLAILSVYPVVYIIRSMINFVSNAFVQIRADKVFSVAKFKASNIDKDSNFKGAK